MPFTIERNDIANMEVDAVVVAANESLRIGGGVGEAVARAAGRERLQAACDAIGHCPTGSAVATPRFSSRARVIVHAVGPVWRVPDDVDVYALLEKTYDSALECAAENGARTIALPLISAGSYGVPPRASLLAAREAIRRFLDGHDEVVVRLVLYDRAALEAAEGMNARVSRYIDDHYVDENAPLGTTVVLPRMPGPSESWRAPAPVEAMPPASEAAARDSVLDGGLDSPPVPDDGFWGDHDEGLALAPQVRSGFKPTEERMLELFEDLDEPFATTVLRIIDERGLADAQVYKRANMSRQLFSKLRGDASYRPAKRTAVALCVALELSLAEARDLLGRAGYALSPSSKADVIVSCFIESGNYDIFEINEALYAFDQPLL